MKINLLALASTAALVCALTACNSEPKATTATAPPGELPSAPASPKPEVLLYATVYDAMLLREQPDQAAKVVEKLPFGEFLEGTGEQSAKKISAELGRVQWNEPFLKAQHLSPQENTGWIFGGGVQIVYAGSRTTSPDLGRLVQLTSRLKSLNPKLVSSGAQAWNYLLTNLQDAKGTLADAAFILLERYLRRMDAEGDFYKFTETMDPSPEAYKAIVDGNFDMTKDYKLKSLLAAGFRLDAAEGMVFPVPDWRNFSKTFAPNVTPPMKKFIEQQTHEHMERESEDGGIIITLEELADRAFFWENFNKENPYFVLGEYTREHERYGRFIITNGENNTPSFEGENGAPVEDFKKVWVYILQKYPGTKLAARVKEFTDLVAAEGGKQTAKVRAAQEAYAREYFPGN